MVWSYTSPPSSLIGPFLGHGNFPLSVGGVGNFPSKSRDSCRHGPCPCCKYSWTCSVQSLRPSGSIVTCTSQLLPLTLQEAIHGYPRQGCNLSPYRTFQGQGGTINSHGPHKQITSNRVRMKSASWIGLVAGPTTVASSSSSRLVYHHSGTLTTDRSPSLSIQSPSPFMV